MPNLTLALTGGPSVWTDAEGNVYMNYTPPAPLQPGHIDIGGNGKDPDDNDFDGNPAVNLNVNGILNPSSISYGRAEPRKGRASSLISAAVVDLAKQTLRLRPSSAPSPGDGTWGYTSGETTVTGVAWDASNGDIETAFEDACGSGNVTVTGDITDTVDGILVELDTLAVGSVKKFRIDNSDLDAGSIGLEYLNYPDSDVYDLDAKNADDIQIGGELMRDGDTPVVSTTQPRYLRLTSTQPGGETVTFGDGGGLPWNFASIAIDENEVVLLGFMIIPGAPGSVFIFNTDSRLS